MQTAEVAGEKCCLVQYQGNYTSHGDRGDLPMLGITPPPPIPTQLHGPKIGTVQAVDYTRGQEPQVSNRGCSQ